MVEDLYGRMKSDPTYERAFNSFYAAASSMRSATSKAVAAERKNVYSDWHSNKLSFISPTRGKKSYGLMGILVSSFGVDAVFGMDSIDKIPSEKLLDIFVEPWRHGDEQYLGDMVIRAINTLYNRGYLARKQMLSIGGTIKPEYKVTKEGHKAFKRAQRLSRRIKKIRE